jgi:hypothetical protein
VHGRFNADAPPLQSRLREAVLASKMRVGFLYKPPSESGQKMRCAIAAHFEFNVKYGLAACTLFLFTEHFSQKALPRGKTVKVGHFDAHFSQNGCKGFYLGEIFKTRPVAATDARASAFACELETQRLMALARDSAFA